MAKKSFMERLKKIVTKQNISKKRCEIKRLNEKVIIYENNMYKVMEVVLCKCINLDCKAKMTLSSLDNYDLILNITIPVNDYERYIMDYNIYKTLSL